VLLPLPLSGAYDYAVQADGPLTRGRLVRAPLGSRSLLGVVWGHAEGAVASDKLRVADALERHRLPETLCDFVDWVARYTLSPPGAVLAQTLRVKDAFDAETPRKALIRVNHEPQLRLTDARSRVLALMADGLARLPADIAELASVSPGVVTGLAEAGALRAVDLPEFERVPEPDPDFNPASLTPDQRRAGEHFREAVNKNDLTVSMRDVLNG
jgi:primosomal protein N' (replication factor Y)